MKYGFLKVAAGTPEMELGNPHYNARRTIEMMKVAAAKGVRVLVLPELGITGYTCGDMFAQKPLQSAALRALTQVAEATAGCEMVTVVGAPIPHCGKLYNCACVCAGGKIIGLVPKKNLPTYAEFYELRNFAPAPAETREVRIGNWTMPMGTNLLFCCDEMPELVLACEVCEDLWTPHPPSIDHTAAGATLIANISASNELVGKASYRRGLASGQSARLVCAYLYADAGEGESTTDLVFAGHNLVSENGLTLAETRPFSGERMAVSEVDLQIILHERSRRTSYPAPNDSGYTKIPFSLPLTHTDLTRAISATPFVPEVAAARDENCEQVLQIQSHALARRLDHTGCKRAVLGISGGLDSALALLATVRAYHILGWPLRDIFAVTMPCFGTTRKTLQNARDLCTALGIPLQTIDITDAVNGHFTDIRHDGATHDITYENAQARERTQVLMDLANGCGGLVVGTGDMSELALGWATYGGDHLSMYGVNASVPKTLVKHVVAHEARFTENEGLRQALLAILNTPVSPELLPPKDGEIAQITEETVGPYKLHDFFLYYVVRWGFSPAKIFYLACNTFSGDFKTAEIRDWMTVFFRRFFAQQFKRSCLPDGPKVGSVALSPRGDWRMPSDMSVKLWMQEIEEIKLP